MNNPFSALVAQATSAASLATEEKSPRAIYRHVTRAERVQILGMLANGMNPYEISAALDRPRITVRRVIAAAKQGGQL